VKVTSFSSPSLNTKHISQVYCFVGGDERRLSQEAERIDLALRLDREAMIKHGKRVGLSLAKRDDVPEEAWENIFAKFRDFKALGDPRDDLYAKQNEGPFHSNTPFHHVNRLKLTESIIKAESILGGADLQLRRQIRNPRDPLAAYFPLQHNPQLKILKAKALRWTAVWNPPTRELAAYYGEQITLYFVFLSTYFKWLLLASVVGAIFGIYQISIDGFDGPGLPAFGIFMIAWSTVFLEVLKRKMASFRVEFGMSNFLEQETVRAEFDGEWVLSPVSGKLEEVFPFWQAVKRKLISVLCVVMYVFCALGAIVGVFALRAALAHTDLELGNILAIAGVVNGLQIQIFNFVYAKVSVGLNDWENHRTDSQYENFLIGKSFGFKVINSFATFIYIGFYKRFDWDVKYCKGSFLQRIAKLKSKDEMVPPLRKVGISTLPWYLL
jgi:anoctamin-10/anoctamin-7